MEVAELPMVDDEYAEHVSIYRSVLRAKMKRQRSPSYSLVVAEVGARWGTWGSRALAFWREVAGWEAAHSVFFAEITPVSCEGIRTVGRLNRFKYELMCGEATATNLSNWIDSVHHVDVIDLGVQGAEGEMLRDASLVARLDAKVARLIIGTHAAELHVNISAASAKRGWRTVWDVQRNPAARCVKRYLRGDLRQPSSDDRFHWKALLDQHCFHYSSRGPVAHSDGELILDNPRLVDVQQSYSLADTELKIGDLLVGRRACLRTPYSVQLADDMNVSETA